MREFASKQSSLWKQEATSHAFSHTQWAYLPSGVRTPAQLSRT
jgi:hypothetical protein